MTAGNSEQSSTDMPNCGISSHQEGISKYRRKKKGSEKADRMIKLGNTSNLGRKRSYSEREDWKTTMHIASNIGLQSRMTLGRKTNVYTKQNTFTQLKFSLADSWTHGTQQRSPPSISWEWLKLLCGDQEIQEDWQEPKTSTYHILINSKETMSILKWFTISWTERPQVPLLTASW